MKTAAAAASMLQPTGYTLNTTRVKTKVPFLLKHKLREYQHIGLDWLVCISILQTLMQKGNDVRKEVEWYPRRRNGLG